jgi:hypothetical protein
MKLQTPTIHHRQIRTQFGGQTRSFDFVVIVVVTSSSSSSSGGGGGANVSKNNE